MEAPALMRMNASEAREILYLISIPEPIAVALADQSGAWATMTTDG